MEYSNYDEINAQDAAEEKKRYQRLCDAMTGVMRSEDGKLVMWHILSECGVFDGGFVDGSMAYFRQGEQKVGLGIIGLMSDADPQIFPELMKEMAEK